MAKRVASGVRDHAQWCPYRVWASTGCPRLFCYTPSSINPCASFTRPSSRSSHHILSASNTHMPRQSQRRMRSIMPGIFSLFNNYLKPSGLASEAPGFVGYAAYCSSAIQLPFLWCRRPDLGTSARANIKINSEIMGTVGRYWKLVAGLVRLKPVHICACREVANHNL